jgi:hypothetical protein
VSRFFSVSAIWIGLLLLVAALPAQDSELKSDQDNAQSPPLSAVENEKSEEEVVSGQASTPPLSSRNFLPISTRAWFSIPDAKEFERRFEQTQIGKMVGQEEMKPFFDELKQKLKQNLDEKNVRIGLGIEDILNIRAGEVCLAGIFQNLDGGQPARGSHGLVLLVDVTGNEPNVEQLLEKLNREFVANKGATLTTLQISGVEVTQISIDNPKRIRQSRNSFQTTYGGWLLIADNEEIFRDILRRLMAPEQINPSQTLAQKPEFAKIMEESSLFGEATQFSWYIDPFGYLELAKKIQDEEQEIRQLKDDWTAELKEIGFDVIRGIGGNMGLSVGVNEQDFEFFGRLFIYAPKNEMDNHGQIIFDLFDFSDIKPGATTPGDLVGDMSSGFFGGNWKFTKLLESIGPIYDSFVGDKEKGAFDRLLDDLANEPDFQVDIRKIVSMLGDQIFVMSELERPVGFDSEHIAVCLPLNETAKADFLMKSLSRAAKGSVEINLGGIKVIEVDTTLDPDLDLEDDFKLPGLDLEPEEEKPRKRLVMFEKRYIAVHQEMLLVTNSKQYMRKLLAGGQKSKLRDADDFQQLVRALHAIVSPEKIAFKRFARNDRILETNYEMLRRGEMVEAQTLVAKITNYIFDQDKVSDQPTKRIQQLNGTSLPEDYQKFVAPFLGPSGWVTELEENGWRVTAGTLKKTEK